MKKVLLILSCIVLFVGLMGCAAFQKNVVDLAQIDAQNAVTTRIAARQICSTWSLNSSALAVILTKYSTLLPCDCSNDIKALDVIAAKCIKKDINGVLTCEELTDQDMGQAVVLWGYTWSSITKSGVNKIMETFFPSILAKILPYVNALGL